MLKLEFGFEEFDRVGDEGTVKSKRMKQVSHSFKKEERDLENSD